MKQHPRFVTSPELPVLWDNSHVVQHIPCVWWLYPLDGFFSVLYVQQKWPRNDIDLWGDFHCRGSLNIWKPKSWRHTIYIELKLEVRTDATPAACLQQTEMCYISFTFIMATIPVVSTSQLSANELFLKIPAFWQQESSAQVTFTWHENKACSVPLLFLSRASDVQRSQYTL